MDRRYQVFVSSTYRDLRDHRQTVIKALLQVDAFPVGMELFPAADDDAWTLIQRVIDESDYHLVIIGGRYGSLDESGISFTEKEYDYAAQKNKPIIAFLHDAPDSLARGNTETDPLLWQKLDAFREKARKKLCRFWTTPEELTIAVLTSFHHLTSTKPSLGWVRGDRARTAEDVQDLLALKQKLSALESEKVDLQRQLDEFRNRPHNERWVPTIAKAFPGFLRRLLIEWRAEVETQPRDWGAARNILEGARSTLLEYVVELDERRNFPIVHELRELVKQIAGLIRQPFMDSGSNDYWSLGESLIGRLENFGSQIESWSWQ